MTENKFNGLTPAQEERLYILIEEAMEVAKVATKILRFGYDSYNPFKPEDGNNLQQLITEMGDLKAAQRLMSTNGDIDPVLILQAANNKYERLSRFLKQQHQH